MISVLAMFPHLAGAQGVGAYARPPGPCAWEVGTAGRNPSPMGSNCSSRKILFQPWRISRSLSWPQMLIFGVTFMSFVVLPFSQVIIVSDLNIGVLYIYGISTITVIGIIMAGVGLE